MSLKEFAAAIWPNEWGSSTIGVKKSTVWTSAISALSWYTPASSLVSKPTSTFGSVGRGKPRKTESSKLGLSFAAQPAALTIAVSFTACVKPHLTLVVVSLNFMIRDAIRSKFKLTHLSSLQQARQAQPACSALRL